MDHTHISDIEPSSVIPSQMVYERNLKYFLPCHNEQFLRFYLFKEKENVNYNDFRSIRLTPDDCHRKQVSTSFHSFLMNVIFYIDQIDNLLTASER